MDVEGNREGQSKCGEGRAQFSSDLKGANIQRRAVESGKLILSERPYEGYSPARACRLGPLPRQIQGCKDQSTLIQPLSCHSPKAHEREGGGEQGGREEGRTKNEGLVHPHWTQQKQKQK